MKTPIKTKSNLNWHDTTKDWFQIWTPRFLTWLLVCHRSEFLLKYMKYKIEILPLAELRVWSAVGPVPCDGVFPFLIDQSNISPIRVLLQAHIPYSNVQSVDLGHFPWVDGSSLISSSPISPYNVEPLVPSNITCVKFIKLISCQEEINLIWLRHHVTV